MLNESYTYLEESFPNNSRLWPLSSCGWMDACVMCCCTWNSTGMGSHSCDIFGIHLLFSIFKTNWNTKNGQNIPHVEYNGNVVVEG